MRVEGSPMSSGERTIGSCLCGGVRFSVSLPTLVSAHCHCSMCRRGHGAGFVSWFTVLRSQLSIDSGAERLVEYRSSAQGCRRFCRRCGSSLFFETSERPEQVDIVLANMSGPIDRDPQLHVHFGDRVGWVFVDDGLPRLGGETGFEPLGNETDAL